MTQIDEVSGMLYKIIGQRIEIHVVEQYDEQPANYIRTNIMTDNHDFWNFVFDAVIESKQLWIDALENEDGDSSKDKLQRAPTIIEQYRSLEKALHPFISASRKTEE